MFCKLFLMFIIYSFIGWLYEITFCIIKTNKWENRGFLFGPICPIYGISGLVIQFLYFRFINYIDFNYEIIYIFFISFFGSAIIEYFTSYIFEKIFHAVWWDYKGQFLNINGRVCLFASIFFGFAGVIFIKYLLPYVNNIVNSIDIMEIELLSLIFMFIFSIDFTLTVCVLTQFLDNVNRVENTFNNKMDNLVNSMFSLQQNAISRVKEFRIPRISKEIINDKISQMKRIIKKEEKNDDFRLNT